MRERLTPQIICQFGLNGRKETSRWTSHEYRHGTLLESDPNGGPNPGEHQRAWANLPDEEGRLNPAYTDLSGRRCTRGRKVDSPPS
jgi:hypothetical protein